MPQNNNKIMKLTDLESTQTTPNTRCAPAYLQYIIF